MGEDSWLEDREFESQLCIPEGNFFTHVLYYLFEGTKINEKEAGDG